MNTHANDDAGSHAAPLTVADDAAALVLAAADPGMRVEIFEPDWAAVDRARTRLLSNGLLDRVGVHHRNAFLCPFVQFMLRRARARAVFVDTH